MKAKPSKILVFRNLNVIVFDEDGNQISELQKSLLSLLAMHAESCGYDLDGMLIETSIDFNYRMFRTEDGWNRELIQKLNKT